MKKFGQIEKISLSSQAIKKLKERILAGQIPPGSHFIADDVATELGISRTPVREALSKLVSEGLVTYDGKGYVVASYTAKDVRELYPIRRILELYAIREAIAHLTAGQISRYRRIYERAEKRIKETGEDANLIMTKLDSELHHLIYEGSKNERLKNILVDIREKIWLIHKWGYVTRKIEYIESAKIEEFGEFLSSLESRDAEKAVYLMEQHLTAAEEFTLECLGFSQETALSLRQDLALTKTKEK
jgi:DNA-binding GntR family transcriptional regulator